MRTLLLFLFALSGLVGLGAPAFADHPSGTANVKYVPDVVFTLRTDIADGKLVYISEAGPTKGQVNPELRVPVDAVVQVNIVNGDGALHDFAIPDFKVKSDQIGGKGSATAIVFKANKAGVYEYLCSLPGHKAAGMFGKLIVGDVQESAGSQFPDLSKNPAEVGEPVGKRGPKTVTFDLETTEVEGRLSDGSRHTFWTFNNTGPGPMLRVRVGDTVNINLKNAEDSAHIHSVDFHAVTGPGGGAAVTQVAPGHTKS